MVLSLFLFFLFFLFFSSWQLVSATKFNVHWSVTAPQPTETPPLSSAVITIVADAAVTVTGSSQNVAMNITTAATPATTIAQVHIPMRCMNLAVGTFLVLVILAFLALGSLIVSIFILTRK